METLQKVTNTSNLINWFPKIEETVSAYNKSRTIEIAGERKTTQKSEEFFTLSEFAAAKSINLKHINSASGILAGLGVLGTFLGLTLGVAQFNSDNADQIAESIRNLMGGMSTAFGTSLAGMFLSILYIWFQKKVYYSSEKAIRSFNNRMDSIYYISVNDVLINDNRLSSEQLLKQIISLQEGLTTFDEEGNDVSIGAMIHNLYEESEKQSQALESFSTDLSNELNASLGKTMDTSIVPIIQKLENSHNEMNQRLETLSETIQAPATDLVTSAVGELKSTMRDISKEFKDSISDNTVEQMETLATNLTKAGDMLNALPQTVEAMSQNVSRSFEEVKSVVSQLQSTGTQRQKDYIDMQSRSSREIERLLQSFGQSIASMQNANNQSIDLLVSMQKSGASLDQSSEQLKELASELISASQTVVQQQKESADSFNEMQQQSQNLIDNLSSALSKSQKMLEEYSNDFETIKGGLNEVFKGIENGLKDYSATLRESTGNALAEYANAITESTKGLKSIADSLGESAEELCEEIDKIKKIK